MATTEELQALLEEARAAIIGLEMRLGALESGPYTYASVMNHTKGGRLRIAGQGIFECEVPLEAKEGEALSKKAKAGKWLKTQWDAECKKLQAKTIDKYPSGTRVLVSKAGAIVDFADDFVLPGQTAIVRRLMENGMIELDGQEGSGSTKMLLPLPTCGIIQPGDQVLQDAGSNVIVYNFGKPIPKTPFKIESDIGVSWDDIGGLDHIREFFREVFILPSQNPDLYKRYSYRPPAGALLSGPPGNGKTLIAKAVATEVARSRGAQAPGFFPVKGPEILSQWVGAAEAAIRELFRSARKYSADHGVPAVVFIDEAEAVMNKRGSGRSSDVDRTIVPAFLTEMDGLGEDKGEVFVLLATNRPDLLDPAIVREGRIDKKVVVPRPSRESAQHIFGVHLRKSPLDNSITRGEAVEHAVAYLWGPHKIAEVKVTGGQTKPFMLHNVLSGAMIAAICQTSAAIALRRDVAAKCFSGITLDDLTAAIDEVALQNKVMSHEDAIKEFCEPFKDDVIEVVKVR